MALTNYELRACMFLTDRLLEPEEYTSELGKVAVLRILYVRPTDD